MLQVFLSTFRPTDLLHHHHFGQPGSKYGSLIFPLVCFFLWLFLFGLFPVELFPSPCFRNVTLPRVVSESTYSMFFLLFLLSPWTRVALFHMPRVRRLFPSLTFLRAPDLSVNLFPRCAVCLMQLSCPAPLSLPRNHLVCHRLLLCHPGLEWGEPVVIEMLEAKFD